MSSNWWASKLGGAPSNPFTPPAPTPQVSQPPRVQDSTPPVQQTIVPQERCPGCGSSNYGGATPESRKRCYDCGYPIVQSGTGVRGVTSGPQASGPTQAAVQVPTGGWNPTTIIGKI